MRTNAVLNGRLLMYLLIAAGSALLSCGRGGVEGAYQVDLDASLAASDRILDQEFNEHFKRVHMEPDAVNRKALEETKERRRKELKTAKVTYKLKSDGTYHAVYVDPFSQESEGNWVMKDDVIHFTPTVVDGTRVRGLSGFYFFYRDGYLTSPPGYPFSWIVLSKR